MTKEEQALFESEVRSLINRNCWEKHSGTPDFIIAKHLLWALLDFNATQKARAEWLGRPLDERAASLAARGTPPRER